MSQRTAEHEDREQDVLSEQKEIERVHPNTLLNDYVTRYTLDFLEQSGLQEELVREHGIVVPGEGASLVRQGSLEHLKHVGVLRQEGHRYHLVHLPDSTPGFDLVSQMAALQRQALDEGRELRRFVVRGSDMWPLVAYGGHCLMLASYPPLFENLWEIDQGRAEYGWGKPLYRKQPDNSDGSGLMMKEAAKRNAAHVVEQYGQDGNLAVLELGSGNASQLVEVLRHVPDGRTPPRVIASDIDVNTRVTAEKNFEDHGFAAHFLWEQINMGNPEDLAKVAAQLKGKRVVILIGYILHESRELAHRTFAAIRAVFPDAIIGASEYYWQHVITPEVPVWFQTGHKMSGQQLYGYAELLQFARGYRYRKQNEVVHNFAANGARMNSAIFFHPE